MKKNKINKKTYLIGFAFVMFLNICLTVFLIRNVLAQTSDNSLKNQPRIVAEVVEQTDRPLLITIINVDNSDESYQTVSYAVQNLSSKKIRAYVLLHADELGSGNTSIQFFESFSSGKTIQSSVFEARANIKANSKIFLYTYFSIKSIHENCPFYPLLR